DYQKCKEVFDKYVSEMEAAYETADALVKELNEKYLDKEKELQRKKEKAEADIKAIEDKRTASEAEYQALLSALASDLEKERKVRQERADKQKESWLAALNLVKEQEDVLQAEDDTITGLESDMAEYKEKADRMRALADSVDNFGMAPTLTGLQSAAKNGRMMHGRVYEKMKDYRKAEDFEDNEEVQDLIDNAISACNTSYKAYEKKAMSRGTTAADYTGFVLSRQTAKYAADKDKAMPYLQMIVDLLHIENTETVHEARELSLIYEWLLPFSMRSFASEKTEESVADYQYYIRMATDRDSVMNAIAFVTGRLEYAYALRSSFAAEGEAASARLEAHIVWLENLLRALREKAGMDSSDDTKTKEEEYLEEKQQAIDEGNLVRARMIDELLKGLINYGDASEDGTGLGDGSGEDAKDTEGVPKNRPTAETAIMEMILDDIVSDGYDIEPDLAKYRGVGGDVGKLADAIDKKGAGDANKRAVAKAEAEEKDGSGDTGSKTLDPTDKSNQTGSTGGESGTPYDGGAGGDGGDSDGEDVTKVPTKTQAADVVNDLTNGDLIKLPEDEQASIIVALSQADPDDGDDLDQYAKELLEQLLRDANSLIYRQYMDDQTQEYVSLGAIDKNRRKTQFRAVKMGADNETTLAMIGGGSASYTYTVGTKNVLKNDGSESALETDAVEQRDPYIRDNSTEKYMYLSEDDAAKYTMCTCEYIYGTDWAILVTPGMEAKIAEIAAILNEKAAGE
ncbi:MAG: hypothetical protein K6G07_00690, partial [Lachnospiraceae bacterium]|nr:hypothetical protein [Lachnospiraceae bacterium]